MTSTHSESHPTSPGSLSEERPQICALTNRIKNLSLGLFLSYPSFLPFLLPVPPLLPNLPRSVLSGRAGQRSPVVLPGYAQVPLQPEPFAPAEQGAEARGTSRAAPGDHPLRAMAVEAA